MSYREAPKMHLWIIAAIGLLASLVDASAQAVRDGVEPAVEVLNAQSSGKNPVLSAGPSGQEEALSDSKKMSDKEKAEMYLALAKLAYDRFDRLADIAWRLRFAVWTAFGLATWFVLASEKWRPRRIECVLASLVTLGLIATVVFIWGPFQYERATRWVRVADYWESAVEHTIGGEKLPDRLRSASLGTGGTSATQKDVVWISPSSPGTNSLFTSVMRWSQPSSDCWRSAPSRAEQTGGAGRRTRSGSIEGDRAKIAKLGGHRPAVGERQRLGTEGGPILINSHLEDGYEI